MSGIFDSCYVLYLDNKGKLQLVDRKFNNKEEADLYVESQQNSPAKESEGKSSFKVMMASSCIIDK